MASPLSKSLIACAIGESGSYLGTLSPVPQAEAEQVGLGFSASVGAQSLAVLRALSVDELFNYASKLPIASLEVGPVRAGQFPARPFSKYAPNLYDSEAFAVG
jgi:para-nitrobenzyl esterase